MIFVTVRLLKSIRIGAQLVEEIFHFAVSKKFTVVILDHSSLPTFQSPELIVHQTRWTSTYLLFFIGTRHSIYQR